MALYVPKSSNVSDLTNERPTATATDDRPLKVTYGVRRQTTNFSPNVTYYDLKIGIE